MVAILVARVTPDTETRILLELGEVKKQLSELARIIHSNGDHPGFEESQREYIRDRNQVRGELGELWEAIDTSKADIVALQAAPGRVALSIADRVAVAVMCALAVTLGGLLGLQFHH